MLPHGYGYVYGYVWYGMCAPLLAHSADGVQLALKVLIRGHTPEVPLSGVGVVLYVADVYLHASVLPRGDEDARRLRKGSWVTHGELPITIAYVWRGRLLGVRAPALIGAALPPSVAPVAGLALLRDVVEAERVELLHVLVDGRRADVVRLVDGC